jgi:hypothetical protein
MLGAAVLAGCSFSASTFSASTGDSVTIDPDKVEGDISSQLREQDPDLPVNSVICPDGVKPAQGATFECSAHVDGAQLPIGVTITQVDLGKGTYDYNAKPTKTLLILEGIVKSIKAALRDQGVPNATVDCGTGRFRVVEVGGAMECTISAGGERRVLRVVAKDEKGRVYFEWAD